MGESRAGARARQAARTLVSASQTAGRASTAAGRGATRTLHKMTHAQGAGRTGLAELIELCAAGSVGDGFVAVALAGTLFFSASVTEARGRVALALLITMAPFALLAPFVGPMLDRVQHGRRYIMIGTVLARGLLCWGMAGAVQHNDTLTLLPAAFGVLLLQKVYSVTRASVTPRLLPREITLVTANARCALASLIATTIGVPVAAGIDALAGGHAGGAAWVLRVGTIVYLLAMIPGIRLPSGVDEPAADPAAEVPGSPGMAAAASGARLGDAMTGGLGNGHGPVAGVAADGAGSHPDASRPASAHPGPGHSGSGHPGGGHPGQPDRERTAGGQQPRLRRKLFPRPVGPIVGEALGANITLRAYSGFMIFFLAFILRTVHFGGVSDHHAHGEMITAVAIGGFIGTAVGAALRSRAPQVIVFGMLTITLVVTALCALYFGLWAAVIVAFAAAAGQTLVKLALDSIVQREISADVRSSTFAASETLHQLSWVLGGLIGLLMSITGSGVAGLSVAAGGLALSLGSLVLARRRRNLRTRHRAVPRMS
jgi:MFS family permease